MLQIRFSETNIYLSGNADLWAHFVKAFVQINWIFSATLAVLG
jgi:hypothetical protein